MISGLVCFAAPHPSSVCVLLLWCDSSTLVGLSVRLGTENADALVHVFVREVEYGFCFADFFYTVFHIVLGLVALVCVLSFL